uniref:NQR2, RnfD, RnfE family n=1 Tax=Candidatus Kentrum sp. LFY TaxID=2126342 RepID=A0A450UCC0_9GAMM|nr:MAG: hypothetical protein BECKLFY1418A_GA0070994_100911 [Candidatus Kentron sp. LFY]
MKTPGIKENTTLRFYPKGNPNLRLFALWYFALLITVWWVGGILYLGFEQSWLQFMVAIGAAMGMQWLLMRVHCTTHDFRPPWQGGFMKLAIFLIPAYIPGVAVAMLIYPNERLTPVIFAAVLAIASKAIFRAPVGEGQTQHIFNPSNLAITVTLFLFPAAVGFAPPYHFTENISGIWDWVVPGVVLLSGILVHAVSTGRLPLILAWLIGFIAQGLLRSFIFGTPTLAPLAPMTSVGFALFTLYMLPDPGTTPIKWRTQVLFGLTVAIVYGFLQVFHVLFGLVVSLTLVCAMRGIWLHLVDLKGGAPSRSVPDPAQA